MEISLSGMVVLVEATFESADSFQCQSLKILNLSELLRLSIPCADVSELPALSLSVITFAKVGATPFDCLSYTRMSRMWSNKAGVVGVCVSFTSPMMSTLFRLTLRPMRFHWLVPGIRPFSKVTVPVVLKAIEARKTSTAFSSPFFAIALNFLVKSLRFALRTVRPARVRFFDGVIPTETSIGELILIFYAGGRATRVQRVRVRSCAFTTVGLD